jgi:uncharacterized protein YegP (UPF0339 family)
MRSETRVQGRAKGGEWMRFKISKATNGQTYFEIQASGNYETLTTSETYKEKSDALHAIDLIKKEAASADIVDDT